MRQHREVSRQRVADEVITLPGLDSVLTAVADVPAPSGASTFTRGPVVRALCKDLEILGPGGDFTFDAHGSGCDTVEFGSSGLRMLAHLDEISYLLGGSCGSYGWPLLAYCYHLAEVPAPARLLRFDSHGACDAVATGRVHSVDGRPFFRADAPVAFEPGDRVTLHAPTEVDAVTHRVTGALDNAAGVACCLLAGAALARCGVPFSLILSDEEEGPAGTANQTISRGASRLYRTLGAAPLTVAVDIHGLSDEDLDQCDRHRRPWGASIAEASSRGRGSVAPPHIYRAVRDVTDAMAEEGVFVRPNVHGHVPRSDDVVAMLETNRVIVLGYPGSNRHFDRGLPTANLLDLRTLARALFGLGCAVGDGRLSLRRR